MACLTKKIVPTIHSPTTADSSQRNPNAPRKKVVATNRIPKNG